MTDPQTPDDLGPDDFDGLGLESLTDGAHATSAQWSAIATDAGRRRQRRSWIVAAAALVVLVVGSAAVVVNRQDTDGSVDIASGGASVGAFVIPPEDASVFDIWVDGPSYSFAYTSEGVSWKLQAQGSTPGTTVPSTDGDRLADITAALGGRPFEVSALGTIYPQCSWYTMETDGSVDTTMIAARGNGPVVAAWRMGGALAGLYQKAPSDLDVPCPIAQGPGDVLLRALEGLRVVDQATFDRYVAEQRDDPSDDTVLLTTTTTSTTSTSTTTTTPTEVDAPADPRSAEEQIVEAVGDWQRRDASGSFVYLEDGTEKAAEYAEMFALAARQSGADQDDGSVEDTAEVSRLEFVTPERARFTIEFTSTLPTGQYTFSQEGEAIVEDGRWVVTYRTVTNTLGRACLPPGGYDGCP